MRKIILTAISILVMLASFAQDSATLTTRSGVSSGDLQTILYFEGISFQKFNIKSAALKGRDYQIIIKEFKDGRNVRNDTAFNSHEDAYFRIKDDSLAFTVLTRMLESNEFKVSFQFNGFSITRRYNVVVGARDKFALKSFFGPKPNNPISLKEKNYLLAYMMPYVRKDKSEAYCEVAQSGVDPEKLYDKYKIPQYFLIELRFD